MPTLETQNPAPPQHDPYTVPCPECNGSGHRLWAWDTKATCPLCKGAGRVSDILAGQWKRIGD